MDNRTQPTALHKELEQRYHLMVPMMMKDDEGKELYLPMVALTANEENKIKQLAYSKTRAMFKDVPKLDEPSNWDELFDNHQSALIIFYATRLPNDLNKFWFINIEQLEAQYTIEQLSTLANAYLTVKLNQPHLKLLVEASEAEASDAFEVLLQQIIKSGTQPDFFLNGYTTHSLKQLIHYLVAKLETSPKDNGASGTP